MKPSLLGALLLSLLVSPCSLATRAADKSAFSGWLEVELVEDSVWWHCELTVTVDEHRSGSMSTGCRPGDSKVAQFRSTKQTLSPDDVQVLRQLLREADVFGDQSWGYDLRGIDMGLSTLVVHDESKVAMLVCDQNKSFETGSRQRLLAWLHKRLSRPGDATRQN